MAMLLTEMFFSQKERGLPYAQIAMVAGSTANSLLIMPVLFLRCI